MISEDRKRLFTTEKDGKKIGISLWEIMACLGYYKRDTNGQRNLGMIIKNAPNINKWAKYKPVRHYTQSPITDEEREDVNYGLEIGQGKYGQELIYLRPRGMEDPDIAPERYRITDFDGYNHDAKNPFTWDTTYAESRAGDYIILRVTDDESSIDFRKLPMITNKMQYDEQGNPLGNTDEAEYVIYAYGQTEGFIELQRGLTKDFPKVFAGVFPDLLGEYTILVRLDNYRHVNDTFEFMHSFDNYPMIVVYPLFSIIHSFGYNTNVAGSMAGISEGKRFSDFTSSAPLQFSDAFYCQFYLDQNDCGEILSNDTFRIAVKYTDESGNIVTEYRELAPFEGDAWNDEWSFGEGRNDSYVWKVKMDGTGLPQGTAKSVRVFPVIRKKIVSSDGLTSYSAWCRATTAEVQNSYFKKI